MRLEYQEVDISNIINHWVKDCKFNEEGESLYSSESFYDPLKGKIVLKLFINEADDA